VSLDQLKWQREYVAWRVAKGQVIVIAGVLDERIAMAIATILRAARQNSKSVFVLDPLETEVYVIARKRLVAATLPPCNGLIMHIDE